MKALRWVMTALLLTSLCLAATHHRRRKAHAGDEPGNFDFYLFVLSWSPEFCHGQPTAAECAAHKGFVVHGLWPQNDDGTYPSHCATTQPPPSNYTSISDIMPQEIIQHEWQTHGTCSGLSGDDYFALIRKVYGSLTVPKQFQSPASSTTLTPHKLKQTFEEVNAQLSDPDIAVGLRGGYLNAVEVCFAKGQNTQPQACSGVREAPGGTFIVPPVR